MSSYEIPDIIGGVCNQARVQSDFITEGFQFGFISATSMIHIHTPPPPFHCGNNAKMVEAEAGIPLTFWLPPTMISTLRRKGEEVVRFENRHGIKRFESSLLGVWEARPKLVNRDLMQGVIRSSLLDC
jgi:hypothetical protein